MKSKRDHHSTCCVCVIEYVHSQDANIIIMGSSRGRERRTTTDIDEYRAVVIGKEEAACKQKGEKKKGRIPRREKKD